ncbi:MAG: transposase [Pyrinomonadaceae bacterium]|nr:transposase [Pyrinomonadaceae bacterium]
MTAKHEKLDEYGFEIWEENTLPLAYLITFRTFGTWLPGDERGSIKRDGWNRYGHPKYRPNPELERSIRNEMHQPAVILTEQMRVIVHDSIRSLCNTREFILKAVNIRTNHGHIVLSASQKPERIADALKANATKALREAGLVGPKERVWARGRPSATLRLRNFVTSQLPNSAKLPLCQSRHINANVFPRKLHRSPNPSYAR